MKRFLASEFPLALTFGLAAIAVGACTAPGGGGGTKDTGAFVPSTDLGVTLDLVTDTPAAPPDAGPATKTPIWSVDPAAPTSAAGKKVQHFGGYGAAGDERLYLCGDAGLFRVRRGGTWEDRDVGGTAAVRGCHALDDDRMIAVADGGKAWLWSKAGAQWTPNEILDGPALRAAWMLGDQEAIAVGAAGSLYRLSGATWTPETTAGVTGTLEALWGTPDASFLVAVGDQVIATYDSKTAAWKKEPLPADPDGTPDAQKGFHGLAVAGVAKNNVWAVGDWGRILYRGVDGTWTHQDGQWSVTAFTAVTAFSPQDVMIVAKKGQVRRFDGAKWNVVDVQSPKKLPDGGAWPSPDARIDGQTVRSYDLVGVWGSGPGALWLIDGAAHLIQYNGRW